MFGIGFKFVLGYSVRVSFKVIGLWFLLGLRS